jgi:hypothetical protein
VAQGSIYLLETTASWRDQLTSWCRLLRTPVSGAGGVIVGSQHPDTNLGRICWKPVYGGEVCRRHLQRAQHLASMHITGVSRKGRTKIGRATPSARHEQCHPARGGPEVHPPRSRTALLIMRVDVDLVWLLAVCRGQMAWDTIRTITCVRADESWCCTNTRNHLQHARSFAGPCLRKRD